MSRTPSRSTVDTACNNAAPHKPVLLAEVLAAMAPGEAEYIIALLYQLLH